jgi:hypothetical protein
MTPEINLRYIVDAYVTVQQELKKEDVRAVIQDEECEKLFLKMTGMLPVIVEVMERHLDELKKQKLVPNVQVIANGPTRAPAPQPEHKDDYTYEEFAELFESNDRPVADSFRVWFEKDFGGWDKTDAQDRVAVWLKAVEYFSKPKPSRAPAPARGGWKEKTSGREECQKCGGTATAIFTSRSPKNNGREYVGCADDRSWFRWVS